MTIKQSEQMFRDSAYQDPGNARQQAARGTYDPAYLNYTLGKLMIRKLRDGLARQAVRRRRIRARTGRNSTTSSSPTAVRRFRSCAGRCWARAGRSSEAAFLERERHPGRPEEGPVPAVSAGPSARCRVPAGDQGRARPDRDRPAGLPRILEFRGQEGLLGHRHLLEGEAAQRHQWLPGGLRRALHVRATSCSATARRKAA